MAYAQTSDVAVELGRPASSPAESDQWQAWLSRVERAIVRGFSAAGLVLADEITAGTVTTDDVRDVEVAVVIRKIQNPTWGESSTTRTIDDGSITKRREGGDLNADPLALLPSDWNGLLPGAQSSGFSTRPGFEPDREFYPMGDWA